MGKLLSKWMNEELFGTEKIKILAREFKENNPFPHILIKDFLKEEKSKELLTELKKERFEEKQSDLFSLSQTPDFAATENVLLKEFYEFFCSKEFTKLMQELCRIKLKGGVDMAGSLYEDADYLLCHDDQLEGRKIAFVYYLSEGFREEDGGALAFLEDQGGKPGKMVERYFPLWNSLMIFEVSRKSWHEVEEVLTSKKRYAIGGWLH